MSCTPAVAQYVETGCLHASSTGALPFTGFGLGPAIVAGVLLALLGAALLKTARR